MINQKIQSIAILATLFISIAFSACKKDRNTESFANGPNVNLYALTNDGKLLWFNAQNPQSITSQATISGLVTGDKIVGIDFRPATGQLYGLGSNSYVYVIDPKTGVSRAINSAPFTPALSGTSFGFDFNPTVDRIRVVSPSGQNLRLNPENGAVAATDLNITVTGAKIGSVAYTQNRAGAATTTLFDIDATTDKLYKQDPPNDGKLMEIGSLGFDIDETGGFDISPDGSAALAVLGHVGKSSLFTIDINTGKAAKIGDFNQQIIGIAIPTEPVAYAISANNELLIFNHTSTTPTAVTKLITGIQAGESILGLDMRPKNGQLYALGSSSRIYTINASSGVATVVGGQLSTSLTGSQFGFDFNPVVDRIRIVSNLGQNLRINPDDAVVAVDGAITSVTASVSGAAYTNNFTGTTSTVLFDIDALGDRLYKQDPPNNGTLVDVGPLGTNVESANGFDIGGTSGIAYGIFTVGSTQRIYTVNLTTGAATQMAVFAPAAKAFTLGLGF
ncbi:DUF4394 domain-containing protein [Pedobacter xixiisoli]|uniref:DNA-binding beta-propeller fold protein YncE n=1 Tax=Pedobacter xixiisoli TaxID=1476464 RepID=A0A286A063_9SPHI|nr:DUF4394 domain-containing protein [Pedobacter xixiisoli]SOD15299.1 DNA-binding beta-propeller fold protein YncE [Pedobacter xixiisoli]